MYILLYAFSDYDNELSYDQVSQQNIYDFDFDVEHIWCLSHVTGRSSHHAKIITFFLGVQRYDTIVFTHLLYVTKLFTARSEPDALGIPDSRNSCPDSRFIKSLQKCQKSRNFSRSSGSVIIYWKFYFFMAKLSSDIRKYNVQLSLNRYN